MKPMCLDWFKGANFAIYACQFLSSWSGRMWGFSIGVFLINVAPGSLQLTAVYGLTMGASVLFFGTVVGDWVDQTPRLRAALISMVMQNSFVIACAVVVLILMYMLTDDPDLDSVVRKVLYGLIIGFSVLSRLLKVGRVIVIERDWIVEIAKSRNTPLTVMTSSFRRIDLLTKIFAPMLTGQILDHVGLKEGCMFIAGWSVVSVCVEFFLIRRVYNIVPALKAQKNEIIRVAAPHSDVRHDASDIQVGARQESLLSSDRHEEMVAPGDSGSVVDKGPKPWTPMRLLASFIIIFHGFRTYFSYDIKWAGLALASLYLTVLGFDGITIGYATTQGISSSTLGILIGVGAVFGICATFTYPLIVRRLGLAKTGVLALGLQVSCLSLCFLSVFLPGSPFDLSYSGSANDDVNNCSRLLNTSSINETASAFGLTTVPSMNMSTDYGASPMFGDNVTTTMLPSNTTDPCVPTDDHGSKLSVYVMLAGIVTARFGLWTADLTIIQLFLERVLPHQRGVVNGFQSSLNQLMDFFKYALVAAIPHPHQFGLLIFISFSFICWGWFLMFLYAVKSWRKERGKDGK